MKLKSTELSLNDAKDLFLNRQFFHTGLDAEPKKKVSAVIEQLGYIQIDTISIVERAHKHVLWSRLPAYRNEMLDELIDKDKKVFEFWDHAAAYMPMKHFRFTLPRKEMYAKKYKHWEKKNRKLLNLIIDRITSEGPLQSRDFEESKKRGQWWDWKPAKEGLEFLFHTGRLTAKARKGFQKVYDLPERTLPRNTKLTVPSDDELSEHLITKAISANGISSEREFTYLRHHNRSATKHTINRLLEEKKIVRIKIKEIENEEYYSTNKILQSISSYKTEPGVHILSPFDNIVIQRKRLLDLFGFEYFIECYIPAPKRKYGYFCLPVLFGNKFAGRIDAKADRRSGKFIIINEFWENGFRFDEEFAAKYEHKLKEIAEFSGCTEISR
ncbi:MAG TPA: crosslink repair DNA glycosylase YcaQ family protein [Ignavibacteria bacterium]|nr:crosslink repair DNA glycosylase YcaQ family protein [Ignavibacteria bacterium]HMR00122.1 crosslink repair DNA glycosylase YcaQ family protein [Ignavibacteria bacterium]